MIETHLPKADGDGVYTKYLTSPHFLIAGSCSQLRWLEYGRRNRKRTFELDRRQIAEGRVKPLAVVDFLDELPDGSPGFGQIAVLLPVNLLVLQSFHERFAGGIVV